jgi:Na+/H+ antiporter NhaB
LIGSVVAAVILLALLSEPIGHVIETLRQSKPVPVSVPVLILLLLICLFNIATSLFTFGALFLLKDVLRDVGEKLPKRRRKNNEED